MDKSFWNQRPLLRPLLNKDVYLFALRNGMLADHARKALDLLIKDKKLPKQILHVSYGAWKKSELERIRYL